MPKVTITVRQQATSATLPHVTVRRFAIPGHTAAEAEGAPESWRRRRPRPRRSHAPADEHTISSDWWDHAHAVGALSAVMRRPRAARNCVEEQAATG